MAFEVFIRNMSLEKVGRRLEKLNVCQTFGKAGNVFQIPWWGKVLLPVSLCIMQQPSVQVETSNKNNAVFFYRKKNTKPLCKHHSFASSCF